MAPARPIRDLCCQESFRSAAGKVIWTRFEEMMSFRDAALEGTDIEGVHDMRVASRRLRAALELFRDVFPRTRIKEMVDEVKCLADALGAVRDTDVLVDRLQNDTMGRPSSQRLALADIVNIERARREEARDHLRQVMGRLEREDFSRRFLTFVAKETM